MAASSALILGACSSNADKGTTSAAPASAVANVKCEGKQSLKASGSTAQANAMKIFSTSFAKTCPGFELAYGGGGSGQGVSDFTQGLTDFGGSDSPLKGDEISKAAARCTGSEAWQLPLVFGPIASPTTSTGSATSHCPARRWPRSSAARSRPGTIR